MSVYVFEVACTVKPLYNELVGTSEILGVYNYSTVNAILGPATVSLIKRLSLYGCP